MKNVKLAGEVCCVGQETMKGFFFFLISDKCYSGKGLLEEQVFNTDEAGLFYKNRANLQRASRISVDQILTSI